MPQQTAERDAALMAAKEPDMPVLTAFLGRKVFGEDKQKALQAQKQKELGPVCARTVEVFQLRCDTCHTVTLMRDQSVAEQRRTAAKDTRQKVNYNRPKAYLRSEQGC